MIRATQVAFVLSMVLLAGCGGEKGNLQKVVAKAGDVEITLADFVDAWNKITPTNRPDISTLEGKRSFANDLVNHGLLLAEARRTAGEMDPGLRKFLDDRRRTELLSALYRDEVEAKVEVQAAEVEELYKKRGMSVRASHILLGDMQTATALRADIVAGKISFEDAAKKHSLDRSTQANGGSLGEIVWMRTLPSFQDRAFSQEPGVISEPFETTFGVHILRVDERIKKELPSFEELRVQLRADVRRQKEQERAKEFTAELEQKANFAWNEEGLAELSKAIDEMTKMDQDTIPTERQYIPPADEARRQVVLATFSDRKWTIGDYITEVTAQPTPNRAPGTLPITGLKELIRTVQITPVIALAEAEARKIGDRPEILDVVQRREDEGVIEMFHARFLQTADLTPEEVRAYFDSTATANPVALQVGERVDMILLAHTEEKAVRDALRRIKNGENEAKVVSEVSVEARTKPNGGRTGLFEKGTFAPAFEEVAFSGRAGKGWSAPIPTEGGFGAVKVLTHEQPRMARFEEIETQLTQSLAQARGEKAFEDWLAAERAKSNVEIFDEALELYDQAITTAKKPEEKPS